jgi:hypothetical protein
MAKKKKQEIPKYIQTKFQKPQYQVGDFVCITWLGSPHFGQIVETDKKNEHVRYKVKSHGTYYTCGIQIGIYKSENTEYGILLADETNRRGEAAIRAKTAGRPIYEIDRRPTASSSNETTSSRQTVNDNIKPAPTSRKRTTSVTTTSAKHGSSHDTKTKSKPSRRKKTELDNAVQKQKDFLNGFVKK